MWDDFLGTILLVLTITFLFIAGILFSVYKYTVEISEANIVKVFVSETKVYEGKKAFVGIDSGGMTTTITIYKKLFPFAITEKVYSSKDVRVE